MAPTRDWQHAINHDEAKNAVHQYFVTFARHALAFKVPLLPLTSLESPDTFADACVEAEALESMSDHGMSPNDEREFRSVCRHEWQMWKFRQKLSEPRDIAQRLHRPGRMFA